MRVYVQPHSAGLLIYRKPESRLEVLLVHPGGPIWAKKDLGAWSIPKGEVAPGEEPLLTARREVREEVELELDGEFHPLEPVMQKGGKLVYAWATEGDCDPAAVASNTFEMEWPPRSGRVQTFPEIDRAEWFSLAEARLRINPAQVSFVDQLEARFAR